MRLSYLTSKLKDPIQLSKEKNQIIDFPQDSSFYAAHNTLRSQLVTQVITQIWQMILFPFLASSYSYTSHTHFPFPTIQPTHSHHYRFHQQSLPLFQPFSKLRLCRGPNEQGCLVRIAATLITPCFTKSSTGITELKTTDSLLLKLRKLI